MKTETIQIATRADLRKAVNAIIDAEGSKTKASLKMGVGVTYLSNYLKSDAYIPHQIAAYFGLRIERVLVKPSNAEAVQHG